MPSWKKKKTVKIINDGFFFFLRKKTWDHRCWPLSKSKSGQLWLQWLNKVSPLGLALFGLCSKGQRSQPGSQPLQSRACLFHFSHTHTSTHCTVPTGHCAFWILGLLSLSPDFMSHCGPWRSLMFSSDCSCQTLGPIRGATYSLPVGSAHGKDAERSLVCS